MKLLKIYLILCVSISLMGCSARTSDEIWDDTVSASRHMGRGLRALRGRHTDSRQVTHKGDFFFVSEDPCEPVKPDFVSSSALRSASVEYLSSAPEDESSVLIAYFEPGEDEGDIPGVDAFKDPKKDNVNAKLYENIYFPYNSSLLQESKDLYRLRELSEALLSSSDVYVFIEGHCDERGPEAFNLSLGSRRAQSVKQILVNQGVPQDRLFTVSYGKERPVALGHDEDAWRLNRRVEFKIYKR